MSSFNPRARVGRDKMKQYFETLYEAFQSTRPRGARRLDNGTGYG